MSQLYSNVNTTQYYRMIGMNIEMREKFLNSAKSILKNKTLSLAVDEHSITPFHSVLGNPPYQREVVNGAVAVYHHMMNLAKEVSEHISMIYPARWISTGRGEGLEDFRNSELFSTHYRTFVIHSGEKAIFTNATIKGGVNYFHWDKTYDGTMTYIYNGYSQKRTSLIDGKLMIIADPRFVQIIDKVQPVRHFIVQSRNYYGIHLESDYSVEKLAANVPEDERNLDQATRVYYSGKMGGVRSTFIPKGSAKYSDEKYKVLVSRTADPDKKRNTLRRQNRIFLIEPGEICGGSFLQAGTYETELEALNVVRYLKTTFAAFMLGTSTHTAATTRASYKTIPDIDFTTGSIKDFPYSDFKLDWAETHNTLDEQLFTFYNIDEEEQRLIHQSVRHWDKNISHYGKDLIAETKMDEMEM